MQSPKPAAIWITVTLLFVIVLVLALFRMWKDWTIGEHHLQQSMPECPHEWRRFTKVDTTKRGRVSITVEQLSVPGPITSVPEYHDCQRLRVSDQYGALAAVFAAHRLDTVFHKLDSLRMVQSFIDGDQQITVGLAVAQVFLQDRDPYPHLGLQLGFNCLFVFYHGELLKARMLPVDMDEERCAGSFNPLTDGGKELPLRRLPPGSFTHGSFPAVARWDWDPATSTQYIGLGCRGAWCEVGNTGSSTAFDPASTSPVRAIKGWYDEQRLALPHPELDDQWQPAPFLGTVMPSPHLKSQELADYTGQWRATGYIAVSASHAWYKAKLNLDQTTAAADTASLNRIEMCYGTWGQCEIPDAAAFPAGSCGVLNGVFSLVWPRWWARIKAAGDGTVAYRCVTRRDHGDANHWVPGTARWRWMARDETVWEECTQGCCEVDVGSS